MKVYMSFFVQKTRVCLKWGAKQNVTLGWGPPFLICQNEISIYYFIQAEIKLYIIQTNEFFMHRNTPRQNESYPAFYYLFHAEESFLCFIFPVQKRLSNISIFERLCRYPVCAPPSPKDAYPS